MPDTLELSEQEKKICVQSWEKSAILRPNCRDMLENLGYTIPDQDVLTQDGASDSIIGSDIDAGSTDIVKPDSGVSDDTNKDDTPPDSSGGDSDDGDSTSDAGDSADADDGADAPDSTTGTNADTFVFDDTSDSSGDVTEDTGDAQGDTVSDDGDAGVVDSIDSSDAGKEDADDGVNSPDAASDTDAGQDDTNQGDTQVSPDTSSDAGSQDADASSDSASDAGTPDISDPDTNVPKCTTAGCDDNNPCTDNVCKMAVGCTSTNNTKTCEDGNACTQKDQCSAGKCQGEVKLCDDGDKCTSDSCDKIKGCVFTDVAKKCDDGDTCTTDSCDKKKGCVNILKSGCKKCKVTSDCDDGNDCTGQTCSGDEQCQFWAMNGAPCSDADACTVGDVCKGDTCTSKAKTCNDGNKCTNDSCDKLKGCVFDFNANSCDDGKVCTVNDACNSGACKGKAKVCDDGNVCTDDACNEKSGCVKSSNKVSCDDGDACTSSDKCSAGTCKAGTSKTCDDKDVCTLDTCDSKTGKCVFAQKKGCWVKIWNPIVKPGLTMGKSQWFNNNVSLWASQSGEKNKEPMWRFSKIHSSGSAVDPNSFNFATRNGHYCGHPNCLDTNNAKNVVGGTVEFPKEYDLSAYPGGVKVTIRYLSRVDKAPDKLTLQASTDGFAKTKVDGTCTAATAKTAGTISYVINIKQTPKQVEYKAWHWKFVTVDVPFAAGKKKVKLRLHFASCDAKGNEGFFALNYLAVEATKLK